MIRVPVPDPTAPQAEADAGARPDPLASFREFNRTSGGWMSLVLVLVMSMAVAWSIGDARWVLGRAELTDFLPWAAIGGVLCGYGAAAAGWSRWRAHLVGAVVAAFVLSVMVGSVLLSAPNASFLPPVPPGASIPETLGAWFGATAASVVDAYIDLAIQGRATTQQLAHFLLLLGTLCWATGQFAAYATFHHRRASNVVLLVGAILVGNMSLTVRDQYGFLVLFTITGLLLLVRMHALDEQQTWLRHHVWRAGSLGTNNYLPGGLGFLALAVIGALVLTGAASSAPLASMWVGANGKLIDIGRQITRFLPAGGQTRINGVAFGPNAPITGSWVTDDTLVMQVHVPDDARYYWRAITYPRFTGTSWTLTDTVDSNVPASTDVLAGSYEGTLLGDLRQARTFTVQPLDESLQLVVSPNSPFDVSEPTRLTLVEAGKESYFGALATTESSQAYQVTASVPVIDATGKQGITANRLRAAGTSYPPELKALYTEIMPGTVGPETRALLATILKESKASNPYDISRAIESYLKDPANFTYDTNVSDVNCAGRSAVDCFVFSRRGYCEHYASTMAMMLRVEGIPARLAEGFLPGDRFAGGIETIRRNRSHAWVEVFFPGYGWIEFDPTGGGVGRNLSLPAGPIVEMPTPGPSASEPGASGGIPKRPGGVDPGQGGGNSSATPGQQGTPVDSRIVFGIVALLLAVAMGALAVAAYVRSGGGPAQPESVYRGITRIARRIGYGPRPTQTVFEYLDALGDALPAARPELEMVGAATVEVAYGRRQLGQDRLVRLRGAERRLRLALLRLLFRRPRLPFGRFGRTRFSGRR